MCREQTRLQSPGGAACGSEDGPQFPRSAFFKSWSTGLQGSVGVDFTGRPKRRLPLVENADHEIHPPTCRNPAAGASPK